MRRLPGGSAPLLNMWLSPYHLRIIRMLYLVPAGEEPLPKPTKLVGPEILALASPVHNPDAC